MSVFSKSTLLFLTLVLSSHTLLLIDSFSPLSQRKHLTPDLKWRQSSRVIQTRLRESVIEDPIESVIERAADGEKSSVTKTANTANIENTYPPVREGDIIDSFCRWTNSAFRNLTISPVRDYLEIMPATSNMTFLQKLTSPPQSPGISRPVTLTIAASVPTGLGWYGYYKFSVEEELFQDEMKREGRVTGCGGYGTLLPFVFLFLIGSVTHFIGPLEDFSNSCLEAGGIWILAGQINLYRRVNELSVEKFGGEPPLHSWWALLPPPLDVVVGLRQVHFLAKYWAAIRGEEFETDVFADKLFPFISSERFTLKEFVLQPKRWFWFTSEAEDFKIDI